MMNLVRTLPRRHLCLLREVAILSRNLLVPPTFSLGSIFFYFRVSFVLHARLRSFLLNINAFNITCVKGSYAMIRNVFVKNPFCLPCSRLYLLG